MSRARRVRLLACLAITLVLMCITLIRMFEGVRPFDWLMFGIEVAVVVLILYEIISEALRRRREAKHKQLVDGQILELMHFLAKGERLYAAVPNTMYSNDQVASRVYGDWGGQVKAWIKETNIVLAERSPKASTEFMDLKDAGVVTVYHGIQPHGFVVRGEAATWYQALAVHIENLKRIISRPEAYF